MSTISFDRLPPATREHPPLVTTFEDRRGTAGMWLTILTEATLFAMLFFAYFFLSRGGWRWPYEQPPKLRLAIPMLIVLLSSSGILHWGERQVRARRYARGRVGLILTILMGIGFLVLSVLEYKDHLKSLKPTSDVYGSIFYTITTFHAAHVIVGLAMLTFALSLPRYEPLDRPPHRPYHNVALYWHFVDLVWVFVVLILYIAPNTR